MMWGRKGRDNSMDNNLKEELLRRLSHTVQEVQLYHSQTGQTGTTDEGTNALVVVMEAIFLHALKQTLLETARKSVSIADDVKPSPSFYDAIRNVTHHDTLFWILKQSRLGTAVGRCRAWLRLALNEAAMSSYMSSLSQDRHIGRYYRPSALLRDREAVDTACRIIEGLVPVPFDIPINSSLLNTWSSEPLLVSGLWSPALRNTPTTAVDVAGTIDDEDICSVVNSTPSVRSLMTLDESQAIKIILETPMFNDEPEKLEEIAKEVDKKMDDLALERHNIMQRSFSTLVESYSPQNDSMLSYLVKMDRMEDRQKRMETSSEKESLPDENATCDEDDVICTNSIVTDHVALADPIPSKQETKRPVEEDYAKLLSMASSSNNERESLEQFFSVDGKLCKKTENKSRKIEDVVFTIAREAGLTSQNMECADCRLSIGFDFGSAHSCSVTGDYLCEDCHKGAMWAIPARIIYNWDHNKYPTGERAAKYLTTVINEPLFNVESINPKLYRVVPDLANILLLRKQLNYLHLYNKTCKQGVRLSVREYLYNSVHLYSLADLSGVVGGTLKAELSKVIAVGKAHVLNCWICKEKGFICELCRDPQVIYPFDEESIKRCQKCQSVYHGKCLSKERNCPKCKRKNERLLNDDNADNTL